MTPICWDKRAIARKPLVDGVAIHSCLVVALSCDDVAPPKELIVWCSGFELVCDSFVGVDGLYLVEDANPGGWGALCSCLFLPLFFDGQVAPTRAEPEVLGALCSCLFDPFFVDEHSAPTGAEFEVLGALQSCLFLTLFLW